MSIRTLVDKVAFKLLSEDRKAQFAAQAVGNAMASIDNAALEALNSQVYDIPYPIDHYYMPVAQKERIIEFNVDRDPCVPTDSIISLDTVQDFLSMIGVSSEEARAVPDWVEVDRLHLGAGYPGIDAYIYHCIIAKIAPPTVVEIGSGMSAFYSMDALARSGGHKNRLFCFEPFPEPKFELFCEANGIRLDRTRLESVDPDVVLAKLKPGSVLFVDSTHAFRADGELPRIILQILPKIPVGCYVHFHDIFLPYAVIHREHNAFSFSHIWNESIALAAFLSGRNDFEVLLPAYWMARHHMDVMEQHLPWLIKEKMNGSSFWMRKTC